MRDTSQSLGFAESQVEVAQCIWETVIEMLHDDRPDSTDGPAYCIRTRGIVETRAWCRQDWMLEACYEGWTNVLDEAGRAAFAPFDWEYVPFFVRNCIDWTPKHIQLRPDWKKILLSNRLPKESYHE